MKCWMQYAQIAGKQADEKQKVVALVAVGQLRKMRRRLDWPSWVALPGAGVDWRRGKKDTSSPGTQPPAAASM